MAAAALLAVGLGIGQTLGPVDDRTAALEPLPAAAGFMGGHGALTALAGQNPADQNQGAARREP